MTSNGSNPRALERACNHSSVGCGTWQLEWLAPSVSSFVSGPKPSMVGVLSLPRRVRRRRSRCGCRIRRVSCYRPVTSVTGREVSCGECKHSTIGESRRELTARVTRPHMHRRLRPARFGRTRAYVRRDGSPLRFAEIYDYLAVKRGEQRDVGHVIDGQHGPHHDSVNVPTALQGTVKVVTSCGSGQGPAPISRSPSLRRLMLRSGRARLRLAMAHGCGLPHARAVGSLIVLSARHALYRRKQARDRRSRNRNPPIRQL
jgi:hypothetical protein